MYDDKKRSAIKITIVFLFIGLPILIMFYDIAVGSFFLLSGLYATHRAMNWIGNQHLQFDRTHQFHNTNATGKNILVQIVDEFGRELPPDEVEKRLDEAQAKADPRDNVIAVKFKVETKHNTSKD